MRHPHPTLEKVLEAWFNGAELAAAWSAAGRPVTWGQMRRVANQPQNSEEHEKRQRQRARKRRRDDDDQSGGGDNDDDHAAAAPVAAASSATAAPSTQEKAPAPKAPPGGSARTGMIKPPVVRRTSHQVAKELELEKSYRVEYVQAHKAAQAEYLAAREANIHRKIPNRVSDIAARHDSMLSEGNPDRITADGLRNFKKRKGGKVVTPQQPGPNMSEAKQALIAVLTSFVQMKQLQGLEQRPFELKAKLLAATRNTIHEKEVDNAYKKERLLLAMKEKTSITSGEGKSVDKRRVDSLTFSQYERWFDGWENILLTRGFGVKRPHPESGEEMTYVSAQKRRRLINPDETHQVMTNELEKGCYAVDTPVCAFH